MSNESTYQGKRMSFYGLFAQDDFRIEIPKIQRDYAQGRPKEETVRAKFLSALFTYLKEGSPNRDLDFIYGNIRNDQSEGKAFIPLDGQQRLTTLFLLHWYLAQIADETSHLQSFLRDNDHSRFTYETRSSSREFCNALITEEFDIDWDSVGSVSEWIRNQGWYFTFWDNDPTVSSMLNMIDEIHRQFAGNQKFYNLLVDENEPVITFQFLNLDEFNLTDDLYIKMNSRGKPLTPFENFKAKLEGEIDLLFQDDPKTYKANWLENKEVSPSYYFSFKIDTEWLGHFWELSEKKPKKVDGYLMNFMRTILTAWYAGHGSVREEGDDKSHVLQILLGTRNIEGQNKQDGIDFYVYDKIGCITGESVTELISAFDILMNLDHGDIKSIPKDQFDVAEIQKKVVEGTLTNQDRLLFHAFIQYLIHYGNNLPPIKNWVRVAFNLIENTRVEFEQLEGGFDELNKLIPYATNILEHLCLPETQISSFYRQQIIEERIKAHLILKTPQWKRLIEQLEGDNFNKGQIGFLLAFSGIWDFFKENGNCEWSDEQNNEYFKLLKGYGAKASAVLPHLQSDLNNSNLWERAVLSKGDYLVPTTAKRWNLLNSTANLRDYSWKRFLRLNPRTDKHYEELAQKRPFVKQVFDDERFDVANPWQSLATIIEDGADDWRNYFIEEPDLFKKCNEGFIRNDGEKEIRILKKKQLNSYHYELYTYAFFIKYLGDKHFDPIGTFHYEKGYGWDYPCYIFSGSWIWKKKTYHLRIYYSSENSFELIFSKVKGNRSEKEYADDIRELLAKLNFEFYTNEPTDWIGYYLFTDDEEKLFQQLQTLFLGLQNL